MIECREYTTKEFKEVTGVSKKHWETNKKEFLEYCSKFFKFTQYRRGRVFCYNVTEILEEWKPYPGKKNVEMMKKFYEEETCRIIEKQPRNTGSNVARILIAEDRNPYIHQERTMTHYIRPCLKNNFSTESEDRAWCELIKEENVYRELTKEELDYLYEECFEKAAFTKKEMMDAIADMKAGTISEEEAGIAVVAYLVGPFETSIDKFKKKYKFRPIRVPLWKAKSNNWEE